MDNKSIPVIWLHPVLLDDFEEWLAARNTKLVEFPMSMQDDPNITQYFVSPKEI
jgi:hypothetical protein